MLSLRKDFFFGAFASCEKLLLASSCLSVRPSFLNNHHTEWIFVKLNICVQGGSNMTGTDLCVNCKQSAPVIFEPPCIFRKSVEKIQVA